MGGVACLGVQHLNANSASLGVLSNFSPRNLSKQNLFIYHLKCSSLRPRWLPSVSSTSAAPLAEIRRILLSKVFSLYDFFRKNIIEIYEFIFITFYCENNSQFGNSAEMFFFYQKEVENGKCQKIRAQRRNVLTDVNKKWFIWKRWGLMLHPKKMKKVFFLRVTFLPKPPRFNLLIIQHFKNELLPFSLPLLNPVEGKSFIIAIISRCFS